MKAKVFNIILASGLYMVLHIATIGVPVSDHYCGNHYVGTEIGLPGDDPCGEMPVDGSCCDDETTLYSVSEKFLKNNYSIEFSFVPLNMWSVKPIDKLLSQDYSYKTSESVMPPLIEHRLFVRVQSFLL